MKSIRINHLITSLALVLFTSCGGAASITDTTSDDNITYQTFYDGLSPYGTWIDYPTYGHVWHPTIAGDFRPYETNGNWSYSDAGWAWQSDYSWGWAPFHYGSWLYDNGYGWLWVPGYTWSPAWVTWGSVDNYYCWAPITPGLGFGFQLGTWRPHDIYWNFCDRSHIYDRNLSANILDRSHVSTYVGQINIINNFHNENGHNYSRGPALQDVEKYTRRTITPVQMRDVHNYTQAGRDGDHMNVYRPTVSRPQPMEFRRPTASQVDPVGEHSQPVINDPERQRSNLGSLPVFRSPANGPRFTPRNIGGRRR